MQLNTFAAPGCYQQFQMLTDEADGGLELSTLRQDTGYLFFTTSERSKQAVSTISRVKQRLLTRFSTYVFEDVDEQAVPVQVSAEAIIETAKQVTGLSVKDLAGIFQVTRQTLYNFRASEDKITDRNWLRLQAVSQEIDNLSKVFTSSPGSLIKRVVDNGNTLYQLLCADDLDRVRIEQLARRVAEQLKIPSGSETRHSATIEQLTRHA